MFDYSELIGRIIAKCGGRKKFCEAMNMSYGTYLGKVNNETSWTQKEMIKAADILDIELQDMYKYFFTAKSSENINL